MLPHSSLSSRLNFMATDKCAIASLRGGLFSVPCTYYYMLSPPSLFWTSRQLNHRLPEKKGSQKLCSNTHFLLCRLPNLQVVWWLRRLGTFRRPQSDSRSRAQALSLPGRVAFPSCYMSASNFLCFCFKFVVYIPTAKQTNPWFGFYFITQMFHFRDQIVPPPNRLLYLNYKSKGKLLDNIWFFPFLCAHFYNAFMSAGAKIKSPWSSDSFMASHMQEV